MERIKNWFKQIVCWAKKHVFHFIITIILSFMGFAMASQYTMHFALRSDIKQFKKEIKSEITNTASTINNNISKTEKAFNNHLNNTSEALNARVDTLSNSVDIEDKRRQLISNIRNAINENISHTVGVRDLNRIANAVIDYSYQYNLTIPQVLAQIKVESDFKVRAESPAGAQGLMQIMPKTLQYIGYDIPDGPHKLNPWNVYHNIKAGCFYMSEQLEEFKSYDEALRAYNVGPDNLKRYNAGERKTLPQETIEYVPRVHRFIEVFNKYGLE